MSWLKSRPSAQAQAPLLDWRAFTERYAQACPHPSGGPAPIHWADDIQHTLVQHVLADGRVVALSPQEVFLQYQTEPATLEQVLADIPATIERIYNQRTPERERIYPIVRHRASLHVDVPEGTPPPVHTIAFALTDELALSFVLDQPEAMTTLTPAACMALDIADEQTLRDLALDNFSAYAGREDRTRLHSYADAPGLHYFELDNVYESSLLLFLKDILDAFAPPIVGRPVVAVPARNVLLVCGADDAPALSAMQQKVQQVLVQFPYLISAQLYQMDEEGNLHVFTPMV